jgi:APA family basic amino acid/polyamine antiporter
LLDAQLTSLEQVSIVRAPSVYPPAFASRKRCTTLAERQPHDGSRRCGGRSYIAAAIAISTLGFLSQSILTAPRVYFAMADDGLFFRTVARIDPRTRVPVAAIVLQSVWTIVIALSGRYEQILNYVVSMDFLFFGLTASTLFVFRRRSKTGQTQPSIRYCTPGHPVTTMIFVAICCWIVANTMYRYPQNSLVGMGLLLAGIPVYMFWNRRARNLMPTTEAARHG